MSTTSDKHQGTLEVISTMRKGSTSRLNQIEEKSDNDHSVEDLDDNSTKDTDDDNRGMHQCERCENWDEVCDCAIERRNTEIRETKAMWKRRHKQNRYEPKKYRRVISRTIKGGKRLATITLNQNDEDDSSEDSSVDSGEDSSDDSGEDSSEDSDEEDSYVYDMEYGENYDEDIYSS